MSDLKKKLDVGMGLGGFAQRTSDALKNAGKTLIVK